MSYVNLDRNQEVCCAICGNCFDFDESVGDIMEHMKEHEPSILTNEGK